MTLKSTGTFAGISCSLFVRLLPFIEQQSVFGLADLNLSVTMQPALNAQQVPLFICPSDLNIRLSTDTPAAYPATYGAGWGDWFGFEFTTAKFGNGAFPETSYPSQRGIRQSEITDGTSYTVGLADVKAFTTYLVRPNSPSANPPATPAALLALGGTANVAGGHASWANGLAFQTGLSFVFPPNTEVPYTNPADGTTYDVDWVGGTVYSCGAVTARSYHSGGVNAAFMDGSVRFITNSIPQATWRALGTRNGGETVDVTQY
ncbi:MAG TPA: DUF1559 domain-containing protein, partial [Gemmataceae bacterium]|nr:DUF1559 domain-containing protein [Gemmataceae bacterium]